MYLLYAYALLKHYWRLYDDIEVIENCLSKVDPSILNDLHMATGLLSKNYFYPVVFIDNEEDLDKFFD